MTQDGSVTTWIGQLREGEEHALAQLHARYWPWLVNLARQKLKGARLRVADEEDIAQQAFWSFYNSFQAGGAPRLASRHDLLALLTTITACKAINQLKHERGVQKRGGAARETLAESFSTDDDDTWGLDAFAAAERTPYEEALLKDSYQHFIAGLPERLQEFAELHLAGCTNREIAERMGCVERTVERKLALALARWQEMAVESVVA